MPVQSPAAKRTTRAGTLREQFRDVASSAQTTVLPNRLPTSCMSGTGLSTATRVSSRTKGKVRYDRLPTGEVVASIVRDESSCPVTCVVTGGTSNTESAGGRRGRLTDDSSCVLPEGYPINRSNVSAVVEEAHRATQSMRILLTSMREELRRAGGLSNEGVRWTDIQLTQRRNIAHRLAVAYQSYRNSVHNIENVQFHTARNSKTGNSGVVLRPTSSGVSISSRDSVINTVVQRARDFAPWQHHVVSEMGSGSEQVIDLTE